MSNYPGDEHYNYGEDVKKKQQYQTKDFPDGKGYTRHGSPTFYSLLEEMANTHDKKSHDYASTKNPVANYHFAGEMGAMFAHSPKDIGFAVRVFDKLHRLANLESGGKTPNYESVEDTERDICVITALWMADRRDRRANRPNKLQHELFDLLKLMPDSQVNELRAYLDQLAAMRANQPASPLRDMELGQQLRSSVPSVSLGSHSEGRQRDSDRK